MIIVAVSGLARQMGMRTVAEGIETLDQAESVLSAGCEELQGFYFSPPVLASTIHTTIAQIRSQVQGLRMIHYSQQEYH